MLVVLLSDNVGLCPIQRMLLRRQRQPLWIAPPRRRLHRRTDRQSVVPRPVVFHPRFLHWLRLPTNVEDQMNLSIARHRH